MAEGGRVVVEVIIDVVEKSRAVNEAAIEAKEKKGIATEVVEERG